MSDSSRDQDQQEEEPYTTKTEREVAFKLIAAHALVDAEYYAVPPHESQGGRGVPPLRAGSIGL